MIKFNCPHCKDGRITPWQKMFHKFRGPQHCGNCNAKVILDPSLDGLFLWLALVLIVVGMFWIFSFLPEIPNFGWLSFIALLLFFFLGVAALIIEGFIVPLKNPKPQYQCANCGEQSITLEDKNGSSRWIKERFCEVCGEKIVLDLLGNWLYFFVATMGGVLIVIELLIRRFYVSALIVYLIMTPLTLYFRGIVVPQVSTKK